MKSIIALLSILLVLGSARVINLRPNGPSVLIEFTSERAQFAPQESQSFKNGSRPQGAQIRIETNQTFQTVKGFGAAFTDSTAYLIKNLPEKDRQDVLEKLFHPTKGIGISYIRLPISVTDFSLTNYTYDNLPPGEVDLLLKKFSIAHDEEYIIPLLKQILKLNPSLKIIVSPWTAPAWFKNTESLMGSTPTGDHSFLKQGLYSVYAMYLVKVLQAYNAHGINIDALTIQNEPLYGPSTYPGMTMQKENQTEFINTHLTPAFILNKISTKLFVFDHNWNHADYPTYVLEHLTPFSQSIVGGIAIHCYEGDVVNQTLLHNRHPTTSIYQTECSGDDYNSDFRSVLLYDMQKLFIGNVNNWGEVSLKWNIALDQDKGPRNGGCPNCRGLIMIHTGTGKITYNPDYYTVGLFSKYAVPGSVRINVTSNDKDLIVTGFKRPDGSILVYVFNQSMQAKDLNLLWEGSYIDLIVPEYTVSVFTWQP